HCASQFVSEVGMLIQEVDRLAASLAEAKIRHEQERSERAADKQYDRKRSEQAAERRHELEQSRKTDSAEASESLAVLASSYDRLAGDLSSIITTASQLDRPSDTQSSDTNQTGGSGHSGGTEPASEPTEPAGAEK